MGAGSVEFSKGVAVVIPCFNAERFLGRTLESVIAQDCGALEIILVDDGSTDASLEIAKGFGRRIKWATGPNRGAAAARNRGLAMTGAKYVLFLDADDYFDGDDYLAGLLARAEETDAAMVFGRVLMEFPDGRRSPPLGASEYRDDRTALRDWLLGLYVPPCGILWRKQFVEQIGGWSPRFPRNQDGEIAMRALQQAPKISQSGIGAGIYVQHNSSSRVSHNFSPNAAYALVEILDEVRDRFSATELDEMREVLAFAYYQVARSLFGRRCDDAAAIALSRARALGFRGDTGNFAHRLVAGSVGLRAKERLWSWMHGVVDGLA